MADRGEEIEVVNEVEFLDQKLSEAQKFDLYRDLQGYRCLWETSNVDYKNRELKEKALEDLSQKFNLTQSFLKRQLHTLRTALVRELKKENEGQQSKWKFYDTLKYMKEDVQRSLKAKEESEWTEGETEQLIEYYKQNEQLWNHHLASYRDRQVRELNYKKLCELLPGRSHDDIKKQWNILKTIFNREVKKEEESKVSGAGTDAVYTSQWKYLKALMFIKGSDDVDPAVSTLDGKENERPAKKMKADRAREFEEVKLELYKEAIKCLQSPLPLSEPANTENRDDSISLFVKSLESTLRRFSGRHLAIAKKRINDVIFEVEMECYAPQGLSTSVPASSPLPSDLVAPAFSSGNLNWPYMH